MVTSKYTKFHHAGMCGKFNVCVTTITHVCVSVCPDHSNCRNQEERAETSDYISVFKGTFIISSSLTALLFLLLRKRCSEYLHFSFSIMSQFLFLVF